MISLASLFLLVKLIMVTVVGLYFAEKCGYTSSEPSHHALLPKKQQPQLRPHLAPSYPASGTRLETMHTVPLAPFPLVSERPTSRSGLQSQEMQRAVQEAVAKRTGSPVRTRSRSSTASSGSVQSKGSEARTRSPLKMAGLSKSKSRSREREGVKEEKKERRASVLRAGRARSSSSSSSSRGVKVGVVN